MLYYILLAVVAEQETVWVQVPSTAPTEKTMKIVFFSFAVSLFQKT